MVVRGKWDPDEETCAYGFWLDSSVLGRLLRALPRSCVNLELDSDGADYSSGPQPYHLCPDIRTVLPRLRNIKLLIQCVCSRLLVSRPADPATRKPPDLNSDEAHLSEAPILETLLISRVNRRDRVLASIMHMGDCSKVAKRIQYGMADPLWADTRGAYDAATSLLVSVLVRAYNLGRFPKARNIEVRQTWDNDTLSQRLPRNAARDSARSELFRRSLVIRDCVRHVRFVLPWRALDDSGNVGLYDREDKCRIGTRNETMAWAEGGTWRETAMYKARLPIGSWRDVQYRRPILFSREEWRERSNWAMVSWKLCEEAEENHVQRVRAHPGANSEIAWKQLPLLKGQSAPGK